MTAPDPGFACEAYPPAAADYGVICFFADRGTRNCGTAEECAAAVAAARQVVAQQVNKPAGPGGEAGAFPFPLAEPTPPPVMVTRPCGCTSMDIGDGSPPLQVSWCLPHDPGYTPPGAP